MSTRPVLNVTLVTTIYPPDIGGPAIYAWDVSRRLRERGHRVAVVTPSPQDGSDPNVHSTGKRVPQIKYVRGTIRATRLLLMLLEVGRRSDVLYVQSPGHLGLIVVVAAWLLRKPFVVRFPGDVAWERAYARGETKKTLHDFLRAPDAGFFTRLNMRLQKLVLRRARQVVTPSDYIREALIEVYGVEPARIHTVYHSLDAGNGPDRPEERQREPGTTLIYVGRLAPQKRIPDLLEAVSLLSGRFPNLQLQLVGDGSEEATLRAQVLRSGLASRVSFLGSVSRPTVLSLMRKADLLVLPSLWESLSHVAIEAIATGIPVVATRIPGLDEVLHDDVAVLVPPCAPKELAEGIARVLTDPDLARRMVVNGTRRAHETFSWQQNLPRLEGVLERAVRGV